jgi:hypothetical protein
MSTSAISAQGSTVHIATGTGGAKTITAITKAFRGEITSTAHGLIKGDRVTFASIAGMTELNGTTATVIDSGTNTFCIDVDTRLLTTYTSGGTATPVTWTEILQIKDFKPSGAVASEIDVTDLKSTAKEFKTGLVDSGSLSMSIFPLTTDPGQIAVKAKHAASTIGSFKLTAPDAKVYTFSAFVKNFPVMPDTAVDGVQTGSIDLRVSGSVTVS